MTNSRSLTPSIVVDILELFQIVRVGTPVRILPQ